MEVARHDCLAWNSAKKSTCGKLNGLVCLLLVGIHGHANTSPLEPAQGISPFARITRAYDSNLLNRPDQGSDVASTSDQVNRLEIGTHLDFQLSQQKLTGLVSLSDTRHDRFTERNTEGKAYRVRWDSEIGRTLIGSIETSAVSDLAPIQTGQVLATQRDQDSTAASLAWNIHPDYAVLSQHTVIETRFEGPQNTTDAVLRGLNRNDESCYLGLAYQPATGSSTTILFKQAKGLFPSRQIIGSEQTVSNNFDQTETELLSKWNYSEITVLTVSISSVDRQHDELQTRDFSGTNYRAELLYKPTVKTNFNLVWGKQIVGVSDASNSDALVRQVALAMNMELTSKLLFQLTYSPQQLEFNGTDGINPIPRTDRLRESSVSLAFQFDPQLTLGTMLRKRSKNSTQTNTDYSAHSVNIFIRYEH